MDESIDIENLHLIVQFLTEISPPRSYDHPKSLDRAAAYIEEKFSQYGYQPEEQLYFFKGKRYRNILATLGPEQAPRLIIGAHYDVCGEQPGADDNASAVAGLLELARLMAKNGDSLRHRIDFATYTLEEPPASFTQQMGSYVHAQSLRCSGTMVLGMIALEMIGYFSDKPESQSYPQGLFSDSMPDVGNFIAVVGRPSDAFLVHMLYTEIRKTLMSVVPLLASPQIPGVGWSDHWGFWQLGFPAVMVTDTAFYRTPNYHQPSGTIDTLDFEKMS